MHSSVLAARLNASTNSERVISRVFSSVSQSVAKISSALKAFVFCTSSRQTFRLPVLALCQAQLPTNRAHNLDGGTASRFSPLQQASSIQSLLPLLADLPHVFLATLATLREGSRLILRMILLELLRSDDLGFSSWRLAHVHTTLSWATMTLACGAKKYLPFRQPMRP